MIYNYDRVGTKCKLQVGLNIHDNINLGIVDRKHSSLGSDTFRLYI